MILDEWKDKLKNKKFILLKEDGDKTTLQDESGQKWYIAKDITNGKITVYNTQTNMMSEKSIYIHKNGKYYVKDSSGKKYFLDDFK